MQNDWISRRITLLEQQVERLNRLPEEIGALRLDIHSEFAALRADLEVRFDAVHQVLISLQTQVTDTNRRMLVLHEAVMAQVTDTNRRMLVLHDAVMTKFESEGERAHRPPTKRRKKQ